MTTKHKPQTGAASLLRSADRISQDPLRVAVIGLGGFGALHARTLRALPEAQLTAVGDRDTKRAKKIARELNVPATFARVEQLIQSRAADALIIATHSDSHARIATTAIKAGLHVLIEKPVGHTLPEVIRLEKLSRGRKNVVMAGHICMFHAQVSQVLQKVQRDGFRALNFVRHRLSEQVKIYRNDHPISLTMVHDLYVLAQLVRGEEPHSFDALDSVGATVPRRAPVAQQRPDMAWATLRWKDGRVATLQSHWTIPSGGPADGWDGMEIFGANYYSKLETNPQNWMIAKEKCEWPSGLDISDINGQPVGMLVEEQRAFIAACRGAPVPAGCRMPDAVQVQRWIERLMKSAKAKRK